MDKLFNFYKLAAVILACMVAVQAGAYDFVEGGIYYNITGNGTVEVTYKDANFNCYSGSVVIPETVAYDGTTYMVTAIGRNAFRESPELTSISIPNTVMTIDYAAFYSCTALSAVTIPSSVTTLGDFCFMSCEGLSSINIPYRVSYIPVQCFLRCYALTSITVPPAVKRIERYAFYGCNSLSSLTLSPGLETIEANAFGECISLTQVTIPSSVTWMDGNVFGASINLSNISVNTANTHYRSNGGVLYDATMDTLIAYPNKLAQVFTVPSGVKAIGKNAFYFCDNITDVILPSSLNYIGFSAFFYCENLTSIHIPAAVNQIRSQAFAHCHSMVEITVEAGNANYMSDDGVLYTGDGKALLQYPCARPDKHYSVLNTVDSIDYYAFASSRVKSVYLPSGPKVIQQETFADAAVERVVIDEGVETICSNAFAGCEHLKAIYLPSSLMEIESLAFQVDTEVEQITFAGTTPPTVGRNAFYGVGYEVGDVDVYVPDAAVTDYVSHNWNSAYFNISVNPIATLTSGVTFAVDSLQFQTIDNNLNLKVTGVTSTALKDPGIPPKVDHLGNLCTVTALEAHSLKNCSAMIRAEVPFTVREIGGYAFYNNPNIQKLRLHEGLKQISQFSLSHINALTSLTIPASVDSISSSFICYSAGLREILVNPSNTKYTSIDGVLFSKNRSTLIAYPNGKTTHYTVPNGTVTIGSIAFRGASRLQEVVMPSTLRTIKSSAFFDNTGLKSIIVPEGVTTIENSAFGGCTGITQAELPSTLTSLCYLAFNNTPQLQTLTVKATVPPVCGRYYDTHSHEIYEPFNDSHYASTQLVVPTGSASTYAATDIWKNFQHISEAAFPTVGIRGDVDGDGEVAISDVSALIDYLLSGGDIVLEAADTDLDGEVAISDVSTLIDYLLSGAWPIDGVDMWYLIGENVGTGDWLNNGPECIGQSLLPLYPVGEFDNYGRGTLTYTGYFGRADHLIVLHTPGSWDDRWGVDQNGNYVHGNSDQVGPFTVSTTGYYTITLDTRMGTFSVEPYGGPSPGVFNSITIVGAHNDWVVSDGNFHMTDLNPAKENHDWLFSNFSTGSYDELKFAADDQWSFNWGEVLFPWGRGLHNGPNVPVEAGTYDVYLNDITGDYNFVKK